ncbi:hypothetical protein L228DRAFT_251005 [Xylona heveae TC161]|uniref:Uncharacterized protein n=1 Tax=Xylona heveae (strain CBS 132557 / TC161) TaxID=1328760 RepID=A0A164ZR60_XYLHT|nr:hypothetical protein L228DRAFT_251005 [Xylona heveae TC161]KZF19404.1 hypothetical protein L228DRAFT_251005 [Xylona heveae TC161]
MVSSVANPLSASSLSKLMALSLPHPQQPDQAGTESQQQHPQLKTAYEAIALFCHACMLGVGFRLIGLGEDDKIEARSEADDTQPLPASWNATTSSSYAFRYAHAQSSMEYQIKISRLGNKAVILGIALGDDKTASFDVAIRDYISESALPLTTPFPPSNLTETPSLPPPSQSRFQAPHQRLGEMEQEAQTEPSTPETTPHTPAPASPSMAATTVVPPTPSHPRPVAPPQHVAIAGSATPGPTPLDEAKRLLQNLFISLGRISDLAALFKISIIQKLAPGLYKPGYEEEQTESASATAQGSSANRPPPRGQRNPDDDTFPQPARPYPFDDPLAIPRPARPPHPPGDFPPPGFEDEYEMNRPPRGSMPGFLGGPGSGPRNPLSIGQDDLYPQGLGPHDPLRGTFGPGGGFGGGGMHPTFDDPLFAGRRDSPQGGVGSRAPLGARYDPVGPGDEPFAPRDRPRFPGGPRGGSGGPPNPFSGFGSGDFI